MCFTSSAANRAAAARVDSGPIKRNLRRALPASGDWGVLVTRPISAVLLAIAVMLLVVVLLPAVSKKREEAFVED